MKRCLAWILAAACLLGRWCSPNLTAYAAEEEVTAAAYVLMELETGTVLLSSHADATLSCGTMAKLMTALLTADQLRSGRWTLETELTADDAVSGVTGAVIWLVPGETMTVGDLLKGLIVGNANDAVIVLVTGVSGDIASFVMDMNARAFEFGMRSTRFCSPQGDQGAEQYITAYDLGLLCRELFRCIELTPYFQTWRDFLRGEDTELVNENTLTRTDDTNIGWKACHTKADGWSIVAGATRGGMSCAAIVLGCQTDADRYDLAKSLLRRGFTVWKVIQPGFSVEFLYPMTVRGGVDAAVLLEHGELHGLVVTKAYAELETVLVLPNYIEAPVRAHQVIGTAAFYQGDTLLYETTIVASQAIAKRNFWDVLKKISVKMHEL